MKCTCEENYIPVDCPLHGSESENILNNRSNAIDCIGLVIDHLTEESDVYNELLASGMKAKAISSIRSSLYDIVFPLEEKQIAELDKRK